MSTIHDREPIRYAKREPFAWNYWQFHWLWYKAPCVCDAQMAFIRECPTCLAKVRERFKDTLR